MGRIKQAGSYQTPRVFEPAALPPRAAQASWHCLQPLHPPRGMIQPEGTENLLGMEHQVNSPYKFLRLEFQLNFLGTSVLLSGWGKGE